MDKNIISRSNYFDGQFLRTQDFSDEQGYHIGMRRRLNIANHTWGIVRGLELCWDTVVGQFVVRPGIAIDGYGRELILPESRSIPISIFNDRGSDTLDVYLFYGLVESDPAPKGYTGCLPDDKSPTGSYYRTQEQATLRVELGEFDVLDRRAPVIGVPLEDLGFDASQTPPDDQLQSWPVFLGQLQRNLADSKQPYTASLSGRPYAGLVGANIYSPLQHARIQLGQTSASDLLSFAVFLTDLADNGDVLDGNPQPAGPQFEITKDNEITIQGNTTVNGEVQINGGALKFTDGSVPQQPRPWQIYHHREVTKEGELVPPEELRIELPEGNGDQKLVIGSWSTKESRFVPCLTIANDCTVTVNGTLKVDKITNLNGEEVKSFNSNLSEQAKQMVLGSLMSGMNSGTNLLQKLDPRIAQPVEVRETVFPNFAMRTRIAQQTATVGEVPQQEPEAAEAGAAQEPVTQNLTTPADVATPPASLVQEVIQQKPDDFANKLFELDKVKAREIRNALSEIIKKQPRK